MTSHKFLTFFLFGDQTLDTYAFLANFCRECSPSITSKVFLERASHALRNEIERLPKIERSRIPLFRTLYQLNERHHAEKTKHLGIESALLCIAEIAHYIDRVEKESRGLEHRDATYAVGICTGLFAAAAVAFATNVSTLVPLGVEATLLAFRTGTYVGNVAETLSPNLDISKPWSFVFSSAKESETVSMLKQFHKDNGISTVNCAYISTASSNGVVVSGPPDTLASLATYYQGSPSMSPLPIYGPYHAPHLYQSVDPVSVLRLDDLRLDSALDNLGPQLHILSPSTGTPFTETSIKSLFKTIFWECLTQKIDSSRLFSSCASLARDFEGIECCILSCGPHLGHDAALARALRSSTKLHVTLQKIPSILRGIPETTLGNHGNQLGRCKLAIVGMAGRFPDAASHEKLWELLAKGLDVHRVVPKDRFPVETHYDPTGKVINTSHTPYGCWIENPGLFDPRFFNMSPREAYQTDPMQRMALTTAYEALEMSGYVPNRTPSTRLDRIGTFYGQTSDDWREINAAQEIDTYFITGGVRAFGPGRINYHFGFSGPSLNIDTACSSSAAALQVACTSLWAHECDTAIVGGLSCMTNPDIFSGLSRGQFLSKTGPCATFDNDADGYCRADACASVIVKRLDDAIFDKDRILAVILGTATNHSANAISITHPHGPTQSLLSSAILDEAGVDPLDVDYVEMHGTGTQAGDGTEMVSVTNVFAPATRRRPIDRPLFIGSVKSNVGHGEAASGVTALCKVLLMLEKNAIPPHAGIKKEMNKTFPKDLSPRNVNIAFHLTPFLRRDGKPRRVFINNFSAAGGNTGLLLEDAPTMGEPSEDPRSVHVITITAKSKASLVRNAENLVGWIEENPSVPLSHVAYTTTARRIQHYWRMSVAASSLSEAGSLIRERLKANFVPVSTESPKVVFLFTGQGSHYAGLGRTLYAHFSVFRESICEFDQLGMLHGFPSFLSLIDGSEPNVQNLSPVVVQLGLCCFEMALSRLWQSWGVKPSVVVGHSLGEYAALHVAGALSASDTVYLVGSRAKLLVEKCTPNTHSMLAIQGAVGQVAEALGSLPNNVNVACVNGPRETVLSGTAKDISGISEQLTACGFKCTQLDVPFAFHSAQVDSILEDFADIARSVKFHKPTLPMISPLLGKLLEEEPLNVEYLIKHAREAVNFLGGLVSAQTSGVINDQTVWLEIGPHPVCANMVKAAFGATTVAAPTLRRSEEAYKTLSNTLCTLHTTGIQIDWNEYHRDFASSVRLVHLRSYAFDEKNYWIQYTGDWCLTKNRIVAAAPSTSTPVKHSLLSTSIHAVTKEELSKDVCVIETETNLSRGDTRKVVTGHLCNGTPLLPSTLYAEMAMAICDYAYKLLRPDSEAIGVNVANMEVPKTLIFDESLDAHILRCTATCNAGLGYSDLVFHTGEGSKRIEHAQCRVFYGDAQAWLQEFDKMSYLVQSRIDYLTEAAKTGKASIIERGLAYKLFTALVDYSPSYQGMKEVILDSKACEATAKIVFQTTESDGSFFVNPYCIDSCCHISGFIVNGSDAIDSREQVFISHGWGSLRLPEKLDPRKTYRSYIRMQPVQGTKMMTGDAYIFDGDRLVGIAGDIRFQSIPRKVLNMVLPPRTGHAAAAPSAAVKTSTAEGGASQAVDSSSKNTKQVTSQNIAAVNRQLIRTGIVGKIMEILAKEMGVGHEELADNIAFTDLGVDSLMGLTVSGRIRENLELDIDSNAFVEHPTIGRFKEYLAQFESATGGSESGGSGGGSSRSDSDVLETETAVTTPLDSDDGSLKGVSEGSSDLQHLLRTTIASEMGVDMDEIIAAPDLAALGMDSLMSLSILGTLREATGRDIPPDLFVDNGSLLAVEKALGIGTPIKNAPNPLKGMSTNASSETAAVSASCTKLTRFSRPINTNPCNTTATIVKPPRPSVIEDNYPHRKATSVLLQGNSRTASRHLFMIPDGSGNAASYSEISKISSEWAVWGLFSPFMKTPHEFTCGVYGMASKFIEEIRRRQAEGPYSLAGWSAGGVIAFEIVHQLTQAGETVDHLVFIDAPCPITIEPLPQGLHQWFASIGLLGDGSEMEAKKLPEWLLPHFAASVTALSNYTAAPLPAQRCPKTTMIWCEDGVCKLPTDPRPDPYPTGHALFLLENKTEFGPFRWEEYLDEDRIVVRSMPGNHFSMMHGELAKKLGDLIREAVVA